MRTRSSSLTSGRSQTTKLTCAKCFSLGGIRSEEVSWHISLALIYERRFDDRMTSSALRFDDKMIIQFLCAVAVIWGGARNHIRLACMSAMAEEVVLLAPGRVATERHTPRTALLHPWLCTLDAAGKICVAGCGAKFARASLGSDSLIDVLRDRVCDHVAVLRAHKVHTHPAFSQIYQAKEGRGCRKASLVERAQDAFAETVRGVVVAAMMLRN